MNFEQYKINFTQKARSSGFSYDIIQRCLGYSEILFSNNLPVIYDLNHLAGLVGYNTNYLGRAAHSTYFFYRHFLVNKKNGKQRLISEPLPSLKEIQYFILQEILYTQKVSKFCKSYIPKKKLNEYVKYHVRSKEVLTLDIEEFFPSIKYFHIIKYFKSLGYSNELAAVLSKLCTITSKDNIEEENERFLPQGAPTSPFLSNLILRKFDEKVAAFCSENNLKYTRYADDMAFSGGKIKREEVIEFVKGQLDLLDLKLNMDKLNFMPRNGKQLVAGVIVNEKMQLPKDERREIRNIIFHIKTKTLAGHLTWINKNPENYLSHLIGRIQYGLNLNPNDKNLIAYKEFLLEQKKAL